MIQVLTSLVLITVPSLLLLQIGKDLLLSKKKFFRFFERLSISEQIFYTSLSFAFVFSIWSLASISGVIDPKFLPTPVSTFSSLWEIITSGELLLNTFSSLIRIIVGFGLAAIVGVAFGSFAGTFSRIESLIMPVNSAIRYIPPTAFIGLTIIWFGIGENSKFALIFFALVFYITQMTFDIVRLVPRTYIESAQTLGANRWEIFTRVILSISLPDLLAVLRVNLGAAWTYLVVAEIVSAQSGLGYLMAISQRYLQTSRLFALIFVVGVLGFLSDSLVALAIRHYSKWK